VRALGGDKIALMINGAGRRMAEAIKHKDGVAPSRNRRARQGDAGGTRSCWW
jgi:hypothetical protein